MYFAYGWPRVAFSDLPPGDAFIYLKATEKYLFAVSRTRVQLWTGGLYRLKVSECVRTEEDVKQEGLHMAALWSPAKATLAVLTSENYLNLYAIHLWKDNLLHPSCNIALKDIQKVDIYLRSSIRMDSESRALSLTGDGRLLLVGFADGTVASLSWNGKMKEVAYPLDDATDLDEVFPGQRSAADANLTTQDQSAALPQGGVGLAAAGAGSGGRGASVFAGPAFGPSGNGYGHSYSGIPQGQASRAIVQMSYCEHSKQVVMVLADGACAVCGTSEGGLSPLSELCFGRWLCGPQQQAVCAQVGARAQLIAVGRENGEVELYRLHRAAIGSPGRPNVAAGANSTLTATTWEPPVRSLSLESWGHKSQQTGSVSQVEWSPDGRALAVGYAGQGVVVWSPSGCRLMCSLRQPAPNSLSTFTSTASRGLMSHQTSLAGRGLPSAAGGADPLQRGTSSLTGPPPQVPLDGGVSALSWGPMGYHLAVAEVGGGAGMGGGGGGLLEVSFAHSLPGHHRVARGGLGTGIADEEVHVLQGHDRVLLIREAGEAAMGVMPWAAGDGAEPAVGQVGDLTVSHVPVPHSYVASNWPLQRSAISSSGTDIAVAGRNGLAVYNRPTERWRLFGDISQERQISCRALGWLSSGVLVACSGPDPNAPPPPSPAPAVPLVVGSAPNVATGCTGNELLLLPRYHLDLTSLLARHPLQQPPIAMDCLGSHILLASEPLEITLLEVALQGELSPTGNPRAIITTLREISMFDVGRYLSDVALVPLLPVAVGAAGAAAGSTAVVAAAPKQCVLLRWGGMLSVLDLEKGAEVALATEIEAFWLSDAITCQTGTSAAAAAAGGDGGSLGAWGAGAWPPPAPPADANSLGPTPSEGSRAAAPGSEAAAGRAGASVSSTVQEVGSNSASAVAAAAAAAVAATLDVEMPWWLYGPAGMQLCFPSSLGTAMSTSMAYKEGHDMELEFDQEVYPVGISLADDAIIGITQRIVRGAASTTASAGLQVVSASQLPCFHPIPESQPVLPCLLRRLLQRGAFKEAVSLARRHARGPHFARSLEWLLFTALEIDTNTSSLARPATAAARRIVGTATVSDTGDGGSGLATQPSLKQAWPQHQSLLAAAAELVRHFPNLFAEVVVSVARKTDAALWPPLFDAVGSPSKLLDGLVDAGELASAACFLLIIDRLEGAPAAQAQALRLMRSSLVRGQYPLCCELLRFVVPPSDQDGDGRLLMSELSFSFSGDLGSMGLPAAALAQPSTPDAEKALAGQQEPAVSASDQEDGSQQGNRTWLGWLLGYGPGPAEQEEQQQLLQQQEQDKKGPSRPPQLQDRGREPEGAPPSAVSRVQQTLALLGEGGSASGRGPNSPAHVGGGGGGGGGSMASATNTALAQILLSGASAGGANSALTAKAACGLVAEHAWRLLESGHLAALGQLVQASGFLPGGLAGLMNQHRDSPYAARGCTSHTAVELLAALAMAVSELPVWSSEEVELCATGVEALCRDVGAVAWSVAMAVLLVDAGTVTVFRQEQPAVWTEFVQMLYGDATFSYLWDIVEVLSGAEDGMEKVAVGQAAAGQAGAGPVAGSVEADGGDRGGDEAATAAASGMFAASAGRVELRSLSLMSAGSEIEEGPQQGGTPAASIPGPRAVEVSIARV